jgi:hypothetical protein
MPGKAKQITEQLVAAQLHDMPGRLDIFRTTAKMRASSL